MKLEEISSGASLEGVEPSGVVTVVAAVPLPPDALQLVYRLPDGGLRERLLSRADEASLNIATARRPWSFDGDGAAFQLTAEAKRIDLAFLFDPMMAVHTSNVDPLPHQITAVYESMLPRQPLRFVLADDPGAGKTIMAGLYIRELIMRADTRRVLIVAPGSLVEQWRDELFEKFGLEFRVFSKDLELALAKKAEPAKTNDSAPTQVRTSNVPGPNVGGGAHPKQPQRSPSAAPPPRAKAFFGSIDINATTAKMTLVSVAEETIALLAADPNAMVKVTVEISAEFPNGATDQIKRAVTENAGALGFKSKSWE